MLPVVPRRAAVAQTLVTGDDLIVHAQGRKAPGARIEPQLVAMARVTNRELRRKKPRPLQGN